MNIYWYNELLYSFYEFVSGSYFYDIRAGIHSEIMAWFIRTKIEITGIILIIFV